MFGGGAEAAGGGAGAGAALDPVGTVRQLVSAEPAALSVEECRALLRQARRLQSWVDARMARLMAVVDAQSRSKRDPGKGKEGAEPSTQERFRGDNNTSQREAQERTESARGIHRLPCAAVALESGEITLAHFVALARLAEHVDDLAQRERAAGGDGGRMRAALEQEEESLVSLAVAMTPERFNRHLHEWRRRHQEDHAAAEDERLRAESYIKRWTRSDGLRGTTIGLDPERDLELQRAIDVVVEEMWRAESLANATGDLPPMVLDDRNRRVEAFMQLIRRGIAAGPGPAARAGTGVMVLIDWQTMVSGLHEASVCDLSDGTPIPPAAARRLACEAGIIPVVLGGDGRPLDVGRASRLATPAQRVALRAMYRECAAQGCDRPFDWCELHHLHPWEHGGRTDLDNLVPLCSRHHHQVHAKSWRVVRDGGAGRVTLVPVVDRWHSEDRQRPPNEWRPPIDRARPTKVAGTPPDPRHRASPSRRPEGPAHAPNRSGRRASRRRGADADSAEARGQLRMAGSEAASGSPTRAPVGG